MTRPPAAPATANDRCEELVVHARELLEDDGKPFLRRIDGALEQAPETLLIHLIAGRELSPTGVSVLLEGRLRTRRCGARFFVRPSNRSVTGYLIGLGLERLLVG